MTMIRSISRRLAAVTPCHCAELGALPWTIFPIAKSWRTMKGTQDFLTVADGAVEAQFRKRIGEVFPVMA